MASRKPGAYAKRTKHKTRHGVLKDYANRRIKVRGTVTRNGSAYDNGRNLPTLLLHEVSMIDPNLRLGDHIWVKLQTKHGAPGRGDKIEFTAVVREYEKQYLGRDKSAARDFGLFDIENIEVVGNWLD